MLIAGPWDGSVLAVGAKACGTSCTTASTQCHGIVHRPASGKPCRDPGCKAVAASIGLHHRCRQSLGVETATGMSTPPASPSVAICNLGVAPGTLAAVAPRGRGHCRSGHPAAIQRPAARASAAWVSLSAPWLDEPAAAHPHRLRTRTPRRSRRAVPSRVRHGPWA